eukprot:1642325-Amphidinium_carterae.1
MANLCRSAAARQALEYLKPLLRLTSWTRCSRQCLTLRWNRTCLLEIDPESAHQRGDRESMVGSGRGVGQLTTEGQHIKRWHVLSVNVTGWRSLLAQLEAVAMDEHGPQIICVQEHHRTQAGIQDAVRALSGLGWRAHMTPALPSE